MTETETLPGPGQRFHFVDGLRGIAALLVVLHHLAPIDRLQSFAPSIVIGLISRGWAGVAVFFVLSGFVIAYSQRGIYITAKYLGNFAFRRCLRLDPPYWAAIIFILVLNIIVNRVRPGREIPFPHPKVILAHLFYVQYLLNYRPISPVFWTLCFEVQFYLILTLAVGAAQRMPFSGRSIAGVKNGSRLFVFAPLALVSLCCFIGWIKVADSIFITKWFSFFLGVLVWAVVEKSVSPRWLWIYVFLIVAAVIPQRNSENFDYVIFWTSTVVVTGLLLYFAGAYGRMEYWLSGRIIQFFGRISYSLYLIHLPIGITLNSLGERICWKSNVLVVLWITMSIGVSIFSAVLMYRWIERPCLKLGQRWKQRSKSLPDNVDNVLVSA